MTNAEKEKALIEAVKKEAARLEKMGIRSQRLAYALNELADKADEDLNYYDLNGQPERAEEYLKAGGLIGHWADFICNSRHERGINNAYDHFNKLSEGGCFLIYDDEIAEAYKWQPKRQPSEPAFYIHLQAYYLATAWARIKELQAKL